MAGGHWPHTVWKYDAGLGSGLSQPLVPFYTGRGYLAAETLANSATDLTVVRARYDFMLTANLVLDASGKTPTGANLWSDLSPVYRIRVQPAAVPPYVDPFGAGFGETDGIADGGFTFSQSPGAVDSATGLATVDYVWQASGNTEGMRKLPGPAGVQVVAVFGWNYDSYLAGYAGLVTAVSWQTNCYLKVLYGSSSTIT